MTTGERQRLRKKSLMPCKPVTILNKSSKMPGDIILARMRAGQ